MSEGKTKELKPIYVASRASIPERGAMWRRFRAEGVQITSSWIDEDGEGQTQRFDDLWERIALEIGDADCLVLYAEADDFPLKGALIEAGLALGMGKPVIVCLPGLGVLPRNYRPIGSWIAHPLVTRCDDINAAVRLATISRASVVAPRGDERSVIDVAQQHDFIQIIGSDRCGLRGCTLGVLEHAWIPPWESSVSPSPTPEQEQPMHTHVMTDADQKKADAIKNEILNLCLHRKANALVALSAVRCAAECFEEIIKEQGGEVFTVSPSQPSARVAAEEIARVFNLEKPGWVTVGRITIDRETETEKFERTSETATDRIEAIITKHCFPSVQPVEEQKDGWVTFGRVKVDIENETETFERIEPE